MASPPTAQEVSALLRALSDPTRLTILDLLMQGVQCNCELGGQLRLPMNLISHHIRVLREAGLVTSRRAPGDARWVYYSIDTIALTRVREQLAAFLDPQRIQPRVPNCGPRSAPMALPHDIDD